MTEHVAVDERKWEPNGRARTDFLGEVTDERIPCGWLLITHVVNGNSRGPKLCGHPERQRNVFDVNKAQRHKT